MSSRVSGTGGLLKVYDRDYVVWLARHPGLRLVLTDTNVDFYL